MKERMVSAREISTTNKELNRWTECRATSIFWNHLDRKDAQSARCEQALQRCPNEGL